MESIWSIVLIVGPLLLLAAIVYAWSKNRKMSQSDQIRANRGARELREEIDANQVDPPKN